MVVLSIITWLPSNGNQFRDCGLQVLVSQQTIRSVDVGPPAGMCVADERKQRLKSAVVSPGSDSNRADIKPQPVVAHGRMPASIDASMCYGGATTGRGFVVIELAANLPEAAISAAAPRPAGRR